MLTTDDINDAVKFYVIVKLTSELLPICCLTNSYDANWIAFVNGDVASGDVIPLKKPKQPSFK